MPYILFRDLLTNVESCTNVFNVYIVASCTYEMVLQSVPLLMTQMKTLGGGK